MRIAVYNTALAFKMVFDPDKPPDLEQRYKKWNKDTRSTAIPTLDTPAHNPQPIHNNILAPRPNTSVKERSKVV